ADMIIQFLGNEDYPLHEDDVSYVLIQFKNIVKKDSSYPYSAINFLS
ncbi:7387_t:CDS:1, partial [Funneliformis geosporum]